ncbi:hypothetical protein N431DRAFT_231139 [Stipitochalara longipes BDJ]|nr:hypothetical protein N431DRAFT_231139 [Stipitochalara longipes BDJ]
MDSSFRPRRAPPVTRTFSRLPPEIREMIWMASFETRIICLHIHQRLAPPHRDVNGHDLQTYQETIAISFSCTVLTSSSSGPGDVNSNPQLTPDEVFQQHWKAVKRGARGNNGDMGTLADKSSRGPVQLYVCRESRALALKRYERAFSGVLMQPTVREINCDWEQRRQVDHQTWNRRKLWEKRIWVDFKSDIIFIDTLKRGPASRNFRLRPVDPLVLMRLYAKDEIKRIRRLAVGGRWVMHCGSNDIAQIGPSLMGSQVSRQRQASLIQGQAGNNTTLDLKYEWLLGLDSLKELLLDDSFGNKKGEMKGKLLHNYRDGAEDVQIDAVKFLEYGRRISEWLKWDIPEVRVLRWDEWKTMHCEAT